VVPGGASLASPVAQPVPTGQTGEPNQTKTASFFGPPRPWVWVWLSQIDLIAPRFQNSVAFISAGCDSLTNRLRNTLRSRLWISRVDLPMHPQPLPHASSVKGPCAIRYARNFTTSLFSNRKHPRTSPNFLFSYEQHPEMGVLRTPGTSYHQVRAWEVSSSVSGDLNSHVSQI
jgi:hypothetical protein